MAKQKEQKDQEMLLTANELAARADITNYMHWPTNRMRHTTTRNASVCKNLTQRLYPIRNQVKNDHQS